jgi:hypothetical protein
MHPRYAKVLSFRCQSVDAVHVPLLGRKKDWVRNQGRANAALLLLARAIPAEFVAPSARDDFAEVRGRVAGCTFELKIVDARLALTVRHFHSQQTFRLDGAGCVLPELDPARLQSAIEDTCERFAATR